jgi:uncharacterized membrane protein
MKQKSDWMLVWQVNADALRSCGSAAMAWITWQSVGTDFYVLGFLSVIFGCAAVICAFRALANTVRLISRILTWRRYRKQGVTPRADGMARQQDLEGRGLLK